MFNKVFYSENLSDNKCGSIKVTPTCDAFSIFQTSLISKEALHTTNRLHVFRSA